MDGGSLFAFVDGVRCELGGSLGFRAGTPSLLSGDAARSFR